MFAIKEVQELRALVSEQRRLLKKLEEAMVNRVGQTVYLGDHVALTRLHSGQKIYVDTRDVGIASHLMLEGCWEPWVEPILLGSLKPGMVFADVGANFGYYSLLGAQAVHPSGKVFAFECNPVLHNLLRRSVSVNGLEGIVTVSGTAVSNRTGEVTLTVDEEFSGGGTTLAAGLESEWSRRQVVVASAPLDELIPETASVNVLKIDVEGAEPLVLSGAKRILSDSALKLLVVEFYADTIARNQPPLEFLSMLSSYGFALQILGDGGLEPPASPESMLTSIGSRLVYIHATRT